MIPGILNRYLALDADVFFFKPTRFVRDGKCLYAFGDEHHPPYFTHMQRLHPGFVRKYAEKSGVCHHMMFENDKLSALFKMVEDNHKHINKQKPFWQLFMDHVDPVQRPLSGASEYELYFNYVLHYHPEHVQIRNLHWRNVRNINEMMDCISHLSTFDYIAYHWYCRDPTSQALFLNLKI